MTQSIPLYNVPKGTALISLQQVIQYSFSFIFYVFLARILTQSQIGEVSLLTFLTSIFGVVTQFSLPIAATKFVAEHLGRGELQQAGAVARSTLKLMLAISTPALIISYLISPQLSTIVFPNSDLTVLVILTFSAAFILDLTTLYGAQLLGLGLYSKMVLQNLVYIPLSRSLGLILAYIGFGVTGIVLGWLIAGLATLFVTLLMVRGRIPQGSSFPTKTLLAYSLPLLGYSLIGIIQGWVDVALLYAFSNSLSATGIYYLLVSSAAVLAIFWAPLAGAIFPALSSAYGKSGINAIEGTLTTSIRLINIAVIPLSLSLAAVSPTLLHIVYGEAYTSGALPFSIISSTIILQAYAAFIFITLQGIGRTRALLMIAAASAALEILSLVFLAKPLGETGASISRTLLFATSVFLGYIYIRRSFQLKLTEALPKSLLVGTIVAIPLGIIDFYLTQYSAQSLSLRLTILTALFTSLFTLTARKLRLFNSSDFDLLRQAFPSVLHRPINAIERALLHY